MIDSFEITSLPIPPSANSKNDSDFINRANGFISDKIQHCDYAEGIKQKRVKMNDENRRKNRFGDNDVSSYFSLL